MNKEQILARLKEIKEALTRSDADVQALSEEYSNLNVELRKAELRDNIAKQLNDEEKPVEPPIDATQSRHGEISVSEKRGKDLKEGRAVTIAASAIVTPIHTSKDINDAFPQVSSIVDLVNVEPMIGGETYKKSYVKDYGTGGITPEGQAATTADPVFGYAEINKFKLTAYSEVSEETKKLPAANYDAVATGGTKIAVRKKLAQQVMIGAGGSSGLKGIFFNDNTEANRAIDLSTDITMDKIDADTLDKIVFAYGGGENVEGDACLILNKEDLRAFALLRNADGKKTYEVEARGNTGLINKIPYVINSACGKLSSSATQVGSYCMAYGHPKNYTVAPFTDLTLEESKDYKFKEGMIAHKASEMVGGAVAAWNGFVRVKKGTPVQTALEYLTITSEAGATAGKTAITVAPTLGTGNAYKYKTASTEITKPAYLEKLSALWKAWDGTADITATTGNQIMIVEVNTEGKAIKYGDTLVVSNPGT